MSNKRTSSSGCSADQNIRKAFVRHELLNIFTVLNISLEEKFASSQELEKILELLHVASLLVEHENILLGEPIRFFNKSISLYKFLENVLVVHEEELTRKRIRVIFPKEDVKIYVDFHQISRVLSEIIAPFIENATMIHFDFESKKQLLKISFGKTKPKQKQQQSLIEYVQKKSRNSFELRYQIALQILSTYSGEITFRENVVCIPLKPREKI